jgi:hypothetical protein
LVNASSIYHFLMKGAHIGSCCGKGSALGSAENGLCDLTSGEHDGCKLNNRGETDEEGRKLFVIAWVGEGECTVVPQKVR